MISIVNSNDFDLLYYSEVLNTMTTLQSQPETVEDNRMKNKIVVNQQILLPLILVLWILQTAIDGNYNSFLSLTLSSIYQEQYCPEQCSAKNV